MNKLLQKAFLFLLCAGWFTAVGIAAEPIAVWKDFAGLTAETPLAPTSSATVNGVDGSLWRFNLAGGSVSDGALTTGTASAPNIAFGSTIDVGYNNKVMTVLLKLQVPVTSVDGAPFVHLGNGTNGIGLASTDTNKVCGSWNNTYWNKDANTGTIDALAAAESGEIYLAVSPCSDGLSFAVVTYEMESLAWTVIASGLRGSAINATQITFGNYVNSTSGGLNYTLEGVAVLSGKATLDEMKGAIRTIEGIQIAEVTRELSGSESWSDADWTPSAPTADSNVTLTVASESTLTMDAAASVVGLTVAGDASLTIATTDSNKLTASTTAINADTTVEAGAASLGAVTLEDEKTITVADTTTVTSLTTTRGVLATSADMTITRDTGFFSGLKVLKVVDGTLTSDVTDSNGNNLTYGRDVIVTGASSNLVINKGDGTGWNSGNNSITLTEGGTLTYNYRDTLKSPFKMSGGTVEFAANCANGSGRALDVYNSNASVNDFTVTALDGATVENPTVSYITALAEESDTSGNRKILLRDGDMIVDVAETAKLHVVAELISVIGNAGGTRGKLVKNGTGVLELAGLENIHETGTNINGGVLILSNRATLGSGTTTIAENAQLVIKQGANKLSNAITNNGTITADTATVDLTGATLSGSGTYAVTNGAILILPLAQTAGKTIEVAEGATLQVELTAVEQLSAQVVTITGTGTVQFVDAGGNVLAEAEGSSAEDSTYTPAIPEYTYTLNGEGAGTWNAAPTAGAKITIAFGETEDQTVDLTTVLGEIASVAELIVTGTNGGSITKTGNGSLIIGEFCPETDVTIDGNILSSCVTAQSTITVPETKTLSIAVADGGSEWDCALKQSFAGAGVVKKIGAGSLSLLDAYTDFTCPQMIVEEGAFRMASGDVFANYANDYAITVNRNAKFMLGYNAALTGNTTITLNDGAAIECKNGNHSTVSTAAIVVNGNATIKGSLYDDETTFSGGVSGNGTLTLEKIADNGNPLTFSGVISGGLQVIISEAQSVTFSGANTYTGGTDIATGAKLTITNAAALGAGTITGAGELICDGVLPTNTTGLTTGTPAEGETPASGWLGTVELDTLSNYCNFATYGNLYSTVRVNGASGYTAQSGSNGTQMATNVEIGENGLTINNGNSGNLSIVTGDLSGTGTITMSASSAAPRLVFVKGTGAFTGDITVAQASGSATKCGAVIFGEASNGNTSNYTLTLGTITDYNPSGKIVVSPNASAKVVGTWTAYQGVHAFGTLSGTGTIDSALTFADGATLDVTAGVLTVTGAVTLPSAMTVKIAEAPAAGTAVAIVKAPFAETGVVDNATVTVMVGDTPAEGTYQLIKTPTALLLDHVPTEDVVITGSSLDASKNWGTDQTGAGNYNGIQVDLDAETPFAPGWTAGALYPVTQFGIMERSDTNNGSIAAGVKVQVYDVAVSTVIATSEAWTEKNATDLVANNGTSSYQLCKFSFAEPVWLDASKTYQFRFVNAEGAAVSCGLRVLNTENSDQRNANLLDSNYAITGAQWIPLYTLTAERIVDNSPIVSGGDEVLVSLPCPHPRTFATSTFLMFLMRR